MTERTKQASSQALSECVAAENATERAFAAYSSSFETVRYPRLRGLATLPQVIGIILVPLGRHCMIFWKARLIDHCDTQQVGSRINVTRHAHGKIRFGEVLPASSIVSSQPNPSLGRIRVLRRFQTSGRLAPTRPSVRCRW
jgi:hypothetical protein